MFDNVFNIVYLDCLPNESLYPFLKREISYDIIDFDIPSLPAQHQIEKEIITYNSFALKLLKKNLPESISRHCIAYSDSSIHAIDYAEIPTDIPLENYLKAIRHECIHILQHLATRIPPHSAIWLYESVACARAKQQAPRPAEIPTWLDFVTQFNAMPNCYALAYVFGTGLLNHFSLGEIIKRCNNFASFVDECKKIYFEVFNK